jgi:uncharacterized radical SAM protein YgiQ
MTRKEMEQRGWGELDILLITGDAYIDHPSYGTAVIGRVLEAEGFRVGVVAQPDWKSTEDFKRLGRPRLFVGITAGNLDSMVSNHTSHKRPRQKDAYSPEGRPGLRPDRATIVYANRVREVFGRASIVIGGIEASLRRLAHYDWWDNAVRRSILLDAKADILVYGMGEIQIREIARRIEKGEDLAGIRGTVIVRKDFDHSPEEVVAVPSYEEVQESKERFNEAFKTILQNQNPVKGKVLLQRHADRMVIHFPPPAPLTEHEIDGIYELPYRRLPHPAYDREGAVPGFETVRFSVVSHRGCCGSCSFCSLSMHQGRIIQSRSARSILKEVQHLTHLKEFHGTISDVGGPTVNLYAARCATWGKDGGCGTRDCLAPSKCPQLKLGYGEAMELYKEIMKVPGVKHMFLESGLRHDLLVDRESDEYLEYICRNHVSGRMKVAPEHAAGKVLQMMNKPAFAVYERFEKRFKELQKRIGKDQYLINYFISAHPGATLRHEEELAAHLKSRGMKPEQIQDFTPLPMTSASCMYYTGKHPVTGEELYVARSFQERKMHRALIQYGNPDNKERVRRAGVVLNKGGKGKGRKGTKR